MKTRKRTILAIVGILLVTAIFGAVIKQQRKGNTTFNDAIFSLDRSEQAILKKQGNDSGYLCFTALEPRSTVAMEFRARFEMEQQDEAPIVSLQYSTDQKNWQDFIVDQTVVTLENAGDKVYFRGNNLEGLAKRTKIDDKVQICFNRYILTGRVSGGGNIMSLLDAENFEELSSVPKWAFVFLFDGCDSLTVAPALPATKLAEGCYDGMFEDCDSLAVAPELPATKLAECCYEFMFCDCDALAIAPELPATELAEGCYDWMFWSCDSLAVAPKLPATKLAEWCYQNMFEDCYSLTTAPELPAMELAEWCYMEMFSGCDSLTVAPELPATKLAGGCYEGMFEGCTSLTTAPELPATELSERCYAQMFDGCTALKSVTIGLESFAGIPYGATKGWLDGVAENGTFTWAGGNSCDECGVSTIPEGWVIVSAK